MRNVLLVALAVAASALAAPVAHAGGMFFPARGARPLGRAGSFVAGADDLEALYYNPAGIAGTGHGSAMLDAGLVFQRVHYDHVDAGGVQQPGVDDNNGILPLPFLGVSWRPEGLSRRVTFGLGVWAPETGIPRYDATGAQRYSLVSLDGTVALVAELAVSIRITPELYLGLGVQDMYFAINNTIALSGCTQLNCAPEDRSFDTITQTKASSAFNPSGNFGLLYVHPKFRIGASAQLPYWIHAQGTIAARLPTDPQFDGAVLVGNQINVDLTLPAVARAGVEARPIKELRIELGFDYETWRMQDKIRFTPVNVYIDHVVGIGRYDLRPMEIDRSMNDVWSLHLGGEYDVLPKRLTIRAGYLFESSAVPDETLTVLTPDGNKHLVAAGVSLRLGKVRLDVGYGHFFQPDRTVTTSRSLQLNPIQPSIAVAVGNGTYMVSTDVLSVGIEGRF
jgi:long-chain fatty acid transport protein